MKKCLSPKEDKNKKILPLYNRGKHLETKDKETISKAARKKVTFKGEIIRLAGAYSIKTKETRRY